MPGVRASALLAFLIALGLAASPSSLAQPPPLDPARPAAGRDTVVIGMSEDEPDTLFSLFATRNSFDALHSVIFTMDTAWGDAWQLSPQGVEYLPNVRDGTWRVDRERMTLVWKLKPRTWHDDRPVTCGDYIFTYNLIRNSRQLLFDPGPIASRIANVTCPDGANGLRIMVTYNARVAGAYQSVLGITGRLPRHILEPYYRASPERLSEVPFGHDPKSTIGDGPYRLVEWRRGHSLTVEAVSNHAIFGTPEIKRIIWRFVPPDGSILAQMLAGSTSSVLSASTSPRACSSSGRGRARSGSSLHRQ